MGNLSITAADVGLIEALELITAPAAEAITTGQVVRLDTSTGKLTPANGSSSGESRAIGIALSSAAAGITLTAVKRGIVDLGDAVTALNYDADVYLSDTDGTLATTTGSVEKIIGRVVPLWAHTTPDKVLKVDL
jgi:predicted RecA/RadA family phage recombinase